MLKLEFVKFDYDDTLTPKVRKDKEHNMAYSLLDKMLKDAGILEYQIEKGENGKPYLKDSKIHFNLSHTKGLAAVCIADCEVGVDCEIIDYDFAPKIVGFSKRYFLENELNLLENSDYSPSVFFEIWTKKEAYIKKHGLNSSAITKVDTTLLEYDVLNTGEYIITIFK